MALFHLSAQHRLLADLGNRLGRREAACLALAGAVLVALGFVLSTPVQSNVSLTAGMALLALAALALVLNTVPRSLRRRDAALLARLHDSDDTPVLLCDAAGRILWSNPRARSASPDLAQGYVAALFTRTSATPERVIARLGEIARATGQADHAGDDWQIHVTAITPEAFLWRLSETGALTPRRRLAYPVLEYDAQGKLRTSQATFADADPPATLPALLPQDATQGPDPVPLALGTRRFRALPLPTQDGGTSVILLPPDDHDPGDCAAGHGARHHDLEQLPIAIAHIGNDGQLCYANSEARRLLRLQPEARPALSELLEGLGRPVAEWLGDILAGRMAQATEVLRLNQPGTETFLKVTLARPAAGTGPRDHVVAVFNDATDFKSLEAKFTQSQKMQAIGLLAGGVAHDFNNLLTAISGHCDLLLLRHYRNDLDYPDLLQIQQNTNRAAALVRQLLALSRQQKLEIVTLDLGETMADLIHLLNRLVGEKITLTLQHGEGVAPIRSDRRQFEQVLMNLVVNARDAMPMGGEIRILTDTCDLPEGLLRPEVQMPAGRYTRIRVQDDGVGMSPATRDKVFDPFFTTKRPGEGTGLGLSTAYGIVKQTGGYIFVDSEEGTGTTFTLYFAAQAPAVPEQQARDIRSPQPGTVQSPPALVLLVEDEAPVRSFAARALELQGHRVIAAESGEAALEILADPAVRPDVFVTDVIMPGIDGPGWVAQVRDRFPDTPVLFVSGYAEDSRVAAQARISNASFLGKPFSLAEFAETVNARLREQAEAA